MMKRIDLTGRRFGRWTVLGFHDSRKQKARWSCSCECGRHAIVVGDNLRNGISTSCGCLRAEMLARPRTEHVTLACPACGREFRRTRRQVEVHGARYCSPQCATEGTIRGGVLAGEKNPAWRGGRQAHPQGYVLVRHDGRYVLEHRLVMARHLGRELTDQEQVHHKNEDKADNRIENLEMTNASDHRRLHPMKAWSKHGHAACVECGGTEARHVTRGLCTRCYDRERHRLHGRRGKAAKMPR